MGKRDNLLSKPRLIQLAALKNPALEFKRKLVISLIIWLWASAPNSENLIFFTVYVEVERSTLLSSMTGMGCKIRTLFLTLNCALGWMVLKQIVDWE